MAKLNKIEESQDILTNRVYEDHEPRIKKIEDTLEIQAA